LLEIGDALAQPPEKDAAAEKVQASLIEATPE